MSRLRFFRTLVPCLGLLGSPRALRAQAPDDDFDGKAAPPTAAATTRVVAEVHPGLDVIAAYAYRRTEHRGAGATWYHEFDVPRVHLALDARLDATRARVVAEGVRSAGDGALVGVDGDSIVFRAREAYTAHTLYFVEGSAGIVPKLTLPELEGTWMLRPVAASAEESQGLLVPSDLGATLRAELPHGHGFVGTGLYNGEGYRNRELNRGKNVEVAASVHPLARSGFKPLALLASYEAGSSGSGRSRANRITGALLWQGQRLRAGISAVYALGVEDDGARRAYLGAAFVRAEPVERVLIGARLTRYGRDADVPADWLLTVDAAAGYRLDKPLEAFIAVTRSQPSGVAEDALAGARYWEGRLISRVVF